MAYVPFNWPKTDGDADRWPAIGRNGAPDVAWHERLAPADKRYELYETKVGQFVASRLALPGSGHRIRLPAGYALFAHCKPQAEGKVREDVYLFGSRHALKFRSPNEFIPHVEWLLNTTNTDDHSSCPCMYNRGSAANAKRLQTATGSSLASGSGTTKRAGQSVGKESRNKKKRVSRPGSVESSDDEETGGIPLDRAIDLRTQRRFRRGELVWIRIKTVTPPPEAVVRGAPSITHWPALVAKIEQKTRIVQVERKGPTWTATSGNNGESFTIPAAPPSPAATPGSKTVSKIIHYYQYHLRPLGFFSPVDELLTDQKEMLPWLIGSELMGGEAGWQSLGEESVYLLEEAARKEAEEEAGLPAAERVPLTADKRWKRSKYAQRVLFKDMPQEWEFLCPRAALAIKMGLVITSSWTQTDMINVVDPMMLSAEDRLAIQQQRKTIYQGLWWGGERLWLEDMVRINKLRSQLPLDQFPIDGHELHDGCVFLKIRNVPALSVLDFRLMSRIIALMVKETDNTTQTATSWKCGVFGDLYELVPESIAQGVQQPMSQVVMKGEEPLITVLRAPRGYKYRQLNGSDTEVMVDVVELAGRVYPDLGDADKQSYFADPKADPAKNEGRQIPGQWMKGLMGLKNATDVFNYSDQWKEDLYAIIKVANKTVESETRDFYAKELIKNGVVMAPNADEEEDLVHRGPVPFGLPIPTPVPTASNGNGDGDGNGDVVMGEPMTLAQAGA